MRNSTINQSSTGVLAAAAVDTGLSVPDAASILRLTNTTVNGGQVRVGNGALLSSRGSTSLTGVEAVNQGAILTDSGVLGFTDSTIDNQAGGRIAVSGGELSLQSTTLSNADDALIKVATRAGSATDALLTLVDSTITDGRLKLSSEPGAQAILQGYGELRDVDLTVGVGSLVDANVLDQRLTVEIGTGSLTNLGIMQASLGGILKLSGGTVTGTGEILALDGSTVEIRNMNFSGVQLRTVGSGVIRDLATSTMANFSNSGLFEVAGDLTLLGNANNQGGEIRVLDGGIVRVGPGGANTATGQPLPFTLDGGRLMLDSGSQVLRAGSALTLVEASVGGFGVINADVYATTGSSIEPGNDAMAGLLTIKGDLTTEVGSQIVLDVFRGTTGALEFDQLLVEGALNLAGTVLFNILDQTMLEEFVNTVTLFELFLGGPQGPAPQPGDFSGMSFEAIMARSLSRLLLAEDGSFSIFSTDPISDRVPEPGVLVLLCIGLLLLSIQACRVSRRMSR